MAAVTGVALASAPTVSAPAPVSTEPLTVLGAASSVMEAESATATGVLSRIKMSSAAVLVSPWKSSTTTPKLSTTFPPEWLVEVPEGSKVNETFPLAASYPVMVNMPLVPGTVIGVVLLAAINAVALMKTVPTRRLARPSGTEITNDPVVVPSSLTLASDPSTPKPSLGIVTAGAPADGVVVPCPAIVKSSVLV